MSKSSKKNNNKKKQPSAKPKKKNSLREPTANLKGTRQVSLAVAQTPHQTATYIRVGKKQMVGGVEQITVQFRLPATELQQSTFSAGLIPTEGYQTTSAMYVSPIFLGGNLFRIAYMYRLFRFTKLRVHFISSSNTTRQGGIAIGYDPNVSQIATTETGEGATATNLGDFFIKIMNLASSAAGPFWGPLVAEGVGLASSGAEAALKWYMNRKSIGVDIQTLSDFFAEAGRSAALDSYLTDLSNHVTALDTATSTPGNPEYTVGPIFGDEAEVTRGIVEGIRRMRGAVSAELLATTQGHIDVSADRYLPGTGTFDKVGVLMIEGEVVLADPLTDFTPASMGAYEGKRYGDPLDDLYPESAPYHPELALPGLKCRYMKPDIESLLPMEIQLLAERHGYPRIKGILGPGTLTSFEVHASRLQELRLLTSRANKMLTLVRPSAPAASVTRPPPTSRNPVSQPDQSQWVDVGRAIELLTRMREGVALTN